MLLFYMWQSLIETPVGSIWLESNPAPFLFIHELIINPWQLLQNQIDELGQQKK